MSDTQDACAWTEAVKILLFYAYRLTDRRKMAKNLVDSGKN